MQRIIVGPKATGIERPAVDRPDVKTLRYRREDGLDRDPAFLSTGRNSGHQAINLAVHLGARHVVLLGFDMGRGPAGALHWHANHGEGMNNPGDDTIDGWRAMMATIPPAADALGVDIVNASRETALRCFRREPIEEMFP